MERYDIAVIGMSGKFSGAADLKEFRKLLDSKRCTVSELSEKRMGLMNADRDRKYMKCGYIEDVDMFDNEFFGITNREARLMSPEQRMSMELVADAIYDAGYSLEGFRGANCGVFVAGGASDYNKYIKRQSSTSIIGSEPYMLSGRIGYMFDLRGENITMNSGCSSSMAAINTACEKLRFGDIDTAVVGGVIVYVEPLEAGDNMYDILGIMSPEYELHAFDEKADGTVIGEGGGYVLLKRLEDAERDRDHIYGIIRSCNVNSDGGRCSSVSMPSTDAQRDVVINAWNGINVSQLTEIEAHGIGALLGDAVEVGGLTDAIKKHNITDKKLPVSSVKSNIGHLVTASGMSSFIKVMMGYENCETYPVVGMDKLSNMIHIEDTGLEILHETKHWNKSDKRMTGISSFGLSGCNAHIVVENRPVTEKSDSGIMRAYKLSARSENALKEMCSRLAADISEKGYSAEDIAYTLNTGRDDFAFRTVIKASDKAELCKSLEEESKFGHSSEKTEYKVVFAAKNEGGDITSDAITEQFPAVSEFVCSDIGDDALRRKTALYRFIESIGIKCSTALVDKVSRAALDISDGKITADELSSIISDNPQNSDYSAYRAQIEKLAAKSKNKLLVVDLSDGGVLCDMDNGSNITVVNASSAEGFAELIRIWYSAGNDIKWNELYRNTNAVKVPLTGYAFERRPFWFRNDEEPAREAVQEKKIQSVILSPLAKMILASKNLKKIFYMDSEDISDVDLSAMPYASPVFKKAFVPESGNIDADYKLAMYRTLAENGITPDIVIADEICRAEYRYLRGWIDREELLDTLDSASVSAGGINTGKLEAIRKAAGNGVAVVFDFSHNSALKEKLSDSGIIVMELFEPKDFEAAVSLNKGAVSDGEADEEEVSSVAAISQTAAEKRVIEKTPEQLDAENFLEEVWGKQLGVNGISHTDNFFALGGNSLIMQAMSGVINEHFNKSFDIFELYDNETIEKLAAVILAA